MSPYFYTLEHIQLSSQCMYLLISDCVQSTSDTGHCSPFSCLCCLPQHCCPLVHTLNIIYVVIVNSTQRQAAAVAVLQTAVFCWSLCLRNLNQLQYSTALAIMYSTALAIMCYKYYIIPFYCMYVRVHNEIEHTMPRAHWYLSAQITSQDHTINDESCAFLSNS